MKRERGRQRGWQLMWQRVHVLNLGLNERLNTAICCIPLSHSDMMAQEFLGQIPNSSPDFFHTHWSHLLHCPNGQQFRRCTMQPGIKLWSPLCSVITIINSQKAIKSTVCLTSVCECLWRNRRVLASGTQKWWKATHS